MKYFKIIIIFFAVIFSIVRMRYESPYLKYSNILLIMIFTLCIYYLVIKAVRCMIKKFNLPTRKEENENTNIDL